ncbi:lyase family protein [Verrucosispora sioxanthis]|uniref:lyase family protein n=1 Tax=Verrucosispora sioxanthis TaxID=2499994 RepID=UPI00209F03F7|nr:lyase family protein [Verrucosispora sioxanthis]
MPWHTRRQPLLDLAAALGGLLAATGKIALDVGLLAQTEVGEVAEGGAERGGSSAMPHKRNPVDSVLVTAVARRGPGLVGPPDRTVRRRPARPPPPDRTVRRSGERRPACHRRRSAGRAGAAAR